MKCGLELNAAVCGRAHVSASAARQESLALLVPGLLSKFHLARYSKKLTPKSSAFIFPRIFHVEVFLIHVTPDLEENSQCHCASILLENLVKMKFLIL